MAEKKGKESSTRSRSDFPDIVPREVADLLGASVGPVPPLVLVRGSLCHHHHIALRKEQ